MMIQVPLSSPDIVEKDIEAVVGVMKTRFLSIGPKVLEFEKRMGSYAGTRYAVAVNSGTSALHLIIRGMGIGEGDVVITTPFSFISSSNCILFERGRPLFVDVEEETLNLDANKLEEKLESLSREELKKVKALLVVDAFGQPADWDRFKEIGKKYNLKLIEDSAEALGSEYKGKMAGSLGEVGVFAFYPNKQITSVVYDTPVMIRENGKVRLIEIGKLMDFMIDNYWKPKGYECLAFNKDGEISWQKIDAFVKHEIHSELLKVQLEKGREVEITKSHSVFTVSDGKIKEVLGKDLMVGDYLIVPRKLPSLTYQIEKIDILNYINNKSIKFNNDKVILKSNGVGGGGGKYINRYIKVNEKFCKLLGYFAAEGGYEVDGGIRFTFGLNEKDTYAKEVKEIWDTIWPFYQAVIICDEKKHKCTVSCGGKLHSELFKNIGCGENVYDKVITNIIWEVSERNKVAFIEGLLNGDGHRRILNGAESYKLKVASKKLANGLHYLLLTMGIQSRLERMDYFSKKGKLCHLYTCEILDRENQRTSRENCIPKNFLSLNINSTPIQKGRIRDKNSVSVVTIEKWMEEDVIDCPDFLLKDLAVLKIRKIERRKFHGFVYDFAVKDLQNFIGGYGGVCLHNTGEGGVLVTDNEELARLARSMRNQGRGESGEWLNHERLGYNYRMDELSAALGCSQMERIEEILDKRAKVAEMYGEKLAEVEEVQVPFIAPDISRMSWFVYVIRLERGIDRDRVIRFLREGGIECKPYFTPIHLQPFYRKMFGYKEGDFPITEDVTGRTIALPFFNNLKEEQIDYVVEKLKEGIEISR